MRHRYTNFSLALNADITIKLFYGLDKAQGQVVYTWASYVHDTRQAMIHIFCNELVLLDLSMEQSCFEFDPFIRPKAC